jgi:hypothetical protein
VIVAPVEPEGDDVTDAATRPAPVDVDATVSWLEEQFPGWQISVDRTDTGVGELRPIWIARCDGHHPQAELSAAKLHTRLSEYLEREGRREALMN